MFSLPLLRETKKEKAEARAVELLDFLGIFAQINKQ